jgi:hypothetical protein
MFNRLQCGILYIKKFLSASTGNASIRDMNDFDTHTQACPNEDPH